MDRRDITKNLEAPNSIWHPQGEEASPTLMVFNIIFLCLGFGVLVLGTIEAFGPVGKYVGAGVCSGFIICGTLMVILGMLGVEAVRNRSIMKCALYYVIILTFVCAGSSIVGLFVASPAGLAERLSSSWDRMQKETIQETQAHFKCCGFKNLNDRPYNPCPPGDPEKGEAAPTTGCRNPLVQEIGGRLGTMGLLSLILAGVEFIGIIITVIVLMRHLAGRLLFAPPPPPPTRALFLSDSPQSISAT